MCLALLGVLTGRTLAKTKVPSLWFVCSSLRGMVWAGAGCGDALGTGATDSTLALKLGGGIGGGAALGFDAGGRGCCCWRVLLGGGGGGHGGALGE